MKTHHNYFFIQMLIYFLLTTLFKLVASSFYKNVADLYDQSSRRISWAVCAYWNSCICNFLYYSLVLTSFSDIANVFQIWSMLQPVAKIFETLYLGLAELTCLWSPPPLIKVASKGRRKLSILSHRPVTSEEERSVVHQFFIRVSQHCCN